MKKGYKMLLLLIIIMFFILFFNSHFVNFLSNYNRIIFLGILLILFNKIFIMEKDKNRFLKELFYEMILYSISFFILFYLLGLIVGLARIPNYYSITGMKDVIIPIVLYTILRELLRYNMLCKAEGNTICTIAVVFIITLLDLTNELFFLKITSNYEALKFIALTLFPTITRNISYSYISNRIGYKVVIAFDLVFTLYKYLIPIIPNPNEYVTSIIQIVIPIVFAVRIAKFFEAKKDDLIPSNYHKIKIKYTLVPLIPVLLMVYLYSGYFRFYAVAIASGSMNPKIEKGDLAIIDHKYKYDKLDIGQVIAYKRDNIIIVHRIVKKININNEILYYTKGDANNNIDDLIINKDMIIGIVDHRIKYIGLPTVWFNNI